MPLVRSSSVELLWTVESLDEVPLLQVRARQLLAGLNFAKLERACIVVAVSEAATNLVKHATGGTLSLRWDDDPPQVMLETWDDGPGIDNPEYAASDFISEGMNLRTELIVGQWRGTGTGLGSIRRMMDNLTLTNRPEGGLLLQASKRLVHRDR
jgi:anti-sigma regulatory factor (Ser/Thr protein kinase)